jgi:hypothetical protein
MLLVLAAGLRPRRDRRGSTPHRRTLLRVIPIYVPPQSPSPCHSVPAGDCLTWPELGQPSAPSHNCQRHYRAAPPSEPVARFPCMGRLLSRATCSPDSFLLLAERRRTAPTLWRATGLGTRTGQGRKPRSGRAQARALTRSIPSPPTSSGINLVKPTNDPSGAMPRARVIAPQPCIRWVY